MFRLLILTLTLSFVLAGCATLPYGNYIEHNIESHNKVMASDAAHQLMLLYPPASTQFNIAHRAEDSFGDALLQSLRMGGYAIHQDQKSNLNKPKDPSVTKGLMLGYIFDQTEDLYRLTVLVDEQVLTRAYSVGENTVNPAGYWVRKE